mgnify:CR=1 FL=1
MESILSAWRSWSSFKQEYAKHGPFWHAVKLAIGLGCVGWVSLLYIPISTLTANRHHELITSFDRMIPFVPWTWWIYFPGYLLGLLAAIVFVKNDKIYFRTVGAIMLAQIFNSLVYLLLPSTFPRPVDWQGSGLTAEAIRWFWTVDPPNNTFPSSHVALAVLAASALWRERNPWRWLPTATAVGIIITVHTTKQHYWVDTLAGLAMAAFCSWLVFKFFPLSRTQKP